MAVTIAGSDCCSSQHTVSPSDLCPSWVHASVKKKINRRPLHHRGCTCTCLLIHHRLARRPGTQDTAPVRHSPPRCRRGQHTDGNSAHLSFPTWLAARNFSILRSRSLGGADTGCCFLPDAPCLMHRHSHGEQYVGQPFLCVYLNLSQLYKKTQGRGHGCRGLLSWEFSFLFHVG